MDEPESEWIIQYRPPIPWPDLDRIQSILREESPFVPGVRLSEPYDVTTYLQRQLIWREEYCLLVDRNVASRWTSAVEGRQVTPEHRKAAAVLAFAQASGLLVEPNIAFYELSTHEDQAKVNREIETFYAALDLPPSKWADIALSRSSRLKTKAPDSVPDGRWNLAEPPYAWRRSYILALKIAELHLEGGRPEELLIRLFDWMYHDFLIGAPAVQLASHYFAPGAPRRRLLKRIQSPDREQALSGIRNAAWDLTLMSEWIGKTVPKNSSGEERRVYILCTLDKAVRRLANSLVSFEEPLVPDLEKLTRIFADLWDPKFAKRLATILGEYQSGAQNPRRQLHRDPGGELMDEMIIRGESVIRNWKAPGGRA